MTLDRRGFLIGGLSLTAGALVGSRAVARQPGGMLVPDVQASQRFAGEPAAGRMYYGASVMYGRSFSGLEARLHGRLTTRRSYFVADQAAKLVDRVRQDHRMSRYPIASTKLPGTWADVAAGAYDAWLVSLLTSLANTARPVMLSLHHEPENDCGPPGMTPESWLAMQRHAIGVARDVAPNTTIVPILMRWTFDPASGRDPQRWVCAESDVFGVDVYNPWSETVNEWRSFRERLSVVLPYTGDRPIVVAEYGCRTDPSAPGRAAQWMTDAFEAASRSNVVAMSYFDSSLNSPTGSWVLDDERISAMSECLRSPLIAKLT